MNEPPYLKAWFLFFLVATLGGAIAGALLGGMLGFVLSMAGVSVPAIKLIGTIAGFIIGLPISFFAFKWSVRRFILPNLSPSAPPVSEDLERTGPSLPPVGPYEAPRKL